MKWRQKAIIQQLIARMPASDALYYGLQRRFGDLRSDRFDPMEWVIVAAEMIASVRNAGFSICGKRCLEVGTGRAIGLPISLWLCGAAQTVTIDLNRYLSAHLVENSWHYLRRNADKVAQMLKGNDEDGGLLNRLDRLCGTAGDINSLLKLTNVVYLAPADATHLAFPNDSFDFQCSYSVLEHVPGPEILAMLVEARRLLRPEGVLLHIFDLSDHFSYGDESITKINFLRFSDAQWTRWAGNKYMYHNRLRPPEFVQLFQQAGVHILRELRGIDCRSLRELERDFPLYERFRHFQPEELAVGAMQIMGTFSTAGATADSKHTVERKFHQ